MNSIRIKPMARVRYLTITVGAAAIAALTAVLIGAPPVPAVAGIGLALAWLIWRAPRE